MSDDLLLADLLDIAAGEDAEALGELNLPSLDGLSAVNLEELIANSSETDALQLLARLEALRSALADGNGLATKDAMEVIHKALLRAPDLSAVLTDDQVGLYINGLMKLKGQAITVGKTKSATSATKAAKKAASTIIAELN